MARRSRFVLVFLALAAFPLAAGALPIAILEVERSARASGAASAGGETAEDSVDLSDAAPGFLDWRTEIARASVGSVGAGGFPSYAGRVDANEILTNGIAESGAIADLAGAFAFGSVEVLERIVFEATADARLRLAGDVLATALTGVSGDSFALVEIMSLGGVLDPNPLLIRRSAAPGEQSFFDLDFEVRSGVSYQILSVARASADALDFDNAEFYASFAVEVTEVPEPGTAVLLLLGVGAFASLNRAVSTPRRRPTA